MARAKKKYYVYAIELDKKVKSFRKIRQANPQRLSNKPWVYIGQSYYPPEIRFEQYKEGYRSNKYAKEYGIAFKIGFKGRGFRIFHSTTNDPVSQFFVQQISCFNSPNNKSV